MFVFHAQATPLDNKKKSGLENSGQRQIALKVQWQEIVLFKDMLSVNAFIKVALLIFQVKNMLISKVFRNMSA